MSQVELKDETLLERLRNHAYAITNPFCYSCYRTAKKGVCPQCHSDDLMRELPGVGVEWGTDWIIEHIIETNLKAIDKEEWFESYLSDVYPETVKIGWIEVDVTSAIKEIDPVSYEIAMNENLDYEVEEGNLIEVGNSYYQISEIEEYLNENEERAA